MAENTYYCWRNQFGGIKADEMKRLKALVADLRLDKVILQESLREISRDRPGAVSLTPE